MKCSFCGTENHDDAKFCKQCGNELKSNICPGCGREIDMDNVIYCKYCGTNIAGGNTVIFDDDDIQLLKKATPKIQPKAESKPQIKPTPTPKPDVIDIQIDNQDYAYNNRRSNPDPGSAYRYKGQGAQNQNYYNNSVLTGDAVPGKNAAIGSMVLGIISLVFWFMGYLAILSTILGVIGLVLANNSKKQGYVGGMRTAGFVCSLIAVIGGTIVFLLAVIAAGALWSMFSTY